MGQQTRFRHPTLCLLLVSTADDLYGNSLDPGEAQHKFRPDQDPNCLTL